MSLRKRFCLREKAQFAGALESAEGQQVIEVIRERLSARIDELINEDPAANALRGLLADMGVKDHQAKQAVDRLLDRFIKQGT